jgi:hypothetical protein
MRWFAVGQEPQGVIAIGQIPTGVIAIGQGATGVVAIGQLARGVVAVGQLSVGVFAFGQLALGAAWAGGMLAVASTTSPSMAGYGALGRWVPWRRDRPQIEPPRSTLALWVRALSVALCTALVVIVVLIPLAEALFGASGVLRPAPPPPVTR